jgi:hypothetical protein
MRALLRLRGGAYYVNHRTYQEDIVASKPSAALAAKIKQDVKPPSDDSLERVRVVLRKTRDLDREIADLEARAKEAKGQVLELKQRTLPDIYDEVGIDNLGLPAEGNLPAYDCKLEPYYHASIGTDWESERRVKAFNYLEEVNAGDLIKSVYIVAVPRGKRKVAIAVQKALEKLNVEFSTDLSVPWNTLTAWVKEQIEKKNTTPNLDVLGATVGRVVKLKERKEK